MIDKIIRDKKLNIIERGIVYKAYEILSKKDVDIIEALSERYDILQHEAMKNIATAMAWFEARNRYDKRVYQGYFLDFLDRYLPFNSKSEVYNNAHYKNATEMVNDALYTTLMEYEVSYICFFLDDYAPVVQDISQDAMLALLTIFEGCFTMDSDLGVFFELESFIESVDWTEWKTEDVIALGKPYLEHIGKHQSFSVNSLDKKN